MRWRIAVLYEVTVHDEEEAWQAGDAICAGTDDCDATYVGVATVGMAGQGILADRLGPLAKNDA